MILRGAQIGSQIGSGSKKRVKTRKEGREDGRVKGQKGGGILGSAGGRKIRRVKGKGEAGGDKVLKCGALAPTREVRRGAKGRRYYGCGLAHR